jgi:hypothetical protein
MPPPFTDQFWPALADYSITMPAIGAAKTTRLTEQHARGNAKQATLLAVVISDAPPDFLGSQKGRAEYAIAGAYAHSHVHFIDGDPSAQKQ